jgi:ABC-type multidrug transport system ATPase subunit
MDLLHRINLKGTTVLIATHNALVVDRMRRRVIRLEDGKIVADEERGYYNAAAGIAVGASDDVAAFPLVRSRGNGLGTNPLLSE